MKRKCYFVIAAAVLMAGLLAGCGNEADETDEAVTQESLYEEETEENDATQDETAGEMPDWLAAYVDYIEGMEDYHSHYSGSFIYVDEDDIPEFVMYTGSAYIVLTFQDGDVDELQTGGLRFRYIERNNLICDASGRAGEYAHHVYSIENGKWTCVADGKFISEFRDGLQFNRYFFEWEGEKVEEELYWDRLHQVFDEEQAIVPKDYRKVADMLYHMKAGDFVWETVDEQHTEEDIGEVIADFEYSDENIPISKVDFASYKNEMSEEDWQVLSSFFPILLEGKTFDVQVYDWKRRADVFEEHSINDLYAVWADLFLEYPNEFVLDEFTLCDITGDGQKELVLYSGFHYAVGMYCIFHREGDHFYAICENIRSFEDLQVNGLYYGAEGASSGSYWRLHFLRDVFWEEEIAKYNAARDYYTIGGEKVSEAEMEAWEDEVMVGDVVWYEARADWELSSNRQRLAAYEMPDWLVAYVDYAEKLEAEDYTTWPVTYSFIYVDADDIPELVIKPCDAWSHVLTFHDGEIDELMTDRATVCYMEKKNFLDNCSGVMGFYHDYIYSIENGKWVYVTGGEYYEGRDEINEQYFFIYEWEGKEVTEDVYRDKLKEVFDVEHAIDPGNFETLEDILSSLQM